MTSLSRVVLGLGAALSLAACAQSVSAPDTTSAGAGGAGASGSPSGVGGSSASTSSVGGSPPGPCVYAEDCAFMSDACNVGACVNAACEKVPQSDGAACDDGKQCTIASSCQAGQCVGTVLQTCPSTGACSVGMCDVATDTCTDVPANDGQACVDQDPCTITGFCQAGQCAPGQAVDCSFLDSVCGIGVCDPGLGCVAMAQNDGTPCDDSLYCTVNDACQGGTCQGNANTCAAPGDVCMIGSCDENANTCVAVPGNDGAACDDGNPCTGGEQCSSGSCLGGAPANNGLLCDDADGCTAGTTCSNGSCGNPQSQIVACVDGDMCCPPGCNDSDCLYWEPGPQLNVPAAALVGWTQCFQESYDGFTQMSSVLQQCDKQKLLLACRPVGAQTFTVLAMAPRTDVLFDCAQDATCSHDANGVAWYYSDEYSWGFAPGGSPVNRFSCDIVDSQTYPGGGASDGDQRICWHTGGGAFSSGWRCGKPDFLGGTHERVIFEAD